jgi:hypothetical protein
MPFQKSGINAVRWINTSALCALVLFAPAQALAESGRSANCPIVSSIDSWHEVDEATAIIETSPRQKFRVTFTTPCRDMSSNLFAHIETRHGGGICLSPGDTIVFGRGETRAHEHYEFEERCTIKKIEPVIASGPEIPPLPPQ